MDCFEFSKKIDHHEVGNLYLFCGEEKYLQRFYLDYLRQKLIDPQYACFNYTKLEGKTDIQHLSDLCETFPVFAEKKLVVFNQSNIFKTGKKDLQGSEEDLFGMIDRLPEYVCLVFVENEIDKRTKLYKRVQKAGGVVEFSHLKPAAMSKWMVKTFKGEGKNISKEAGELFLNFCDESMDVVYNEIMKVCRYAQDKDIIEAEDVKAVCTPTVKATVFMMTDALGQGDKNASLKIIEEMIILNTPVQMLFITLAQHLRKLLVVKDYSAKGYTGQELSKAIGSSSAFYASKLLSQAKGFSLKTLAGLVSLCAELDIAIKTGRIKDRMALELIVATIAH